MNRYSLFPGVMLLVAAPFAQAADQVDVHLSVSSKGGQPALVIDRVDGDAGPCDGGTPLTECFELARTKKNVKIDFLLDGACGSEAYGLDRVELAMPDQDFNSADALTSYAQFDFSASPSGRPSYESKRPDRLRISDQNRGKPHGTSSYGAYDVKYQVIATHCDTGEALAFDPTIRNKGDDN